MSASRVLLCVVSIPAGMALAFFLFFLLPAGSILLVPTLVLVPLGVVWAVERATSPSRAEDAAQGLPPRTGPRGRGWGFPLVTAALLGTGTWLLGLVVGIGMGVVPFMMPHAVPHPWEDHWGPAVAWLGLLSVPLWWWLIDRAGRRGVADRH